MLGDKLGGFNVDTKSDGCGESVEQSYRKGGGPEDEIGKLCTGLETLDTGDVCARSQ